MLLSNLSGTCSCTNRGGGGGVSFVCYALFLDLPPPPPGLYVASVTFQAFGYMFMYQQGGPWCVKKLNCAVLCF